MHRNSAWRVALACGRLARRIAIERSLLNPKFARGIAPENGLDLLPAETRHLRRLSNREEILVDRENGPAVAVGKGRVREMGVRHGEPRTAEREIAAPKECR